MCPFYFPSTFLVASLLSFLYQLKTENQRLEDYIKTLTARRDHLLALNARLALPLPALSSSQLMGKSIESPCGLSQHFTSQSCIESTLAQDMSSNCSSHTPSNHSPGHQQSSTPGYQHISSPNGSFHGSSHGVHPSSCSPVQPSLSRNSVGLSGTSLDSSRHQQNSTNSQDQHMVYSMLQQQASSSGLSQGSLKSTSSPNNLNATMQSSASFNPADVQMSNKTSHDTKVKEKS